MLPEDRQNLLFSATMPDSIVKLASGFLTDPVRVEVDRQSTTVERIIQKVMFVARPDKRRLLRHLLAGPEIQSAIVFTRTKHGANRVTRDLVKAGVNAAAIHGNKTQNARQRSLAGFKAGDVRVLVATDIASRGIDVDGVSHIINFDLPNISESYVHRIGRTGRAGKEGIAIAFCDESETAYLVDIEKLIDKPLEVDLDHEWHLAEAMPTPRKPTHHQRRWRGGRSNQGGGGAPQEKSGAQRRDGDRSQRRRRRRPRRPGGDRS